MAKYNLDLAADAADQLCTFEIPKQLAPYVREFYEVRKRAGETFEQFVCRHVREAAVHWKMGELSQQIVRDNQNATTADAGDLAEQASTLLAQNSQ